MTALAEQAPSIRLEVRGLTAAYGPNPALRGLDARIFAGEIVAILGENGSGKSTLLKVIARILPPAAGEVLLDGRPLPAIARRETARRIAYVAQSADLVFPIRSSAPQSTSCATIRNSLPSAIPPDYPSSTTTSCGAGIMLRNLRT